MASIFTNKFKYKLLGWGLRNETAPTTFYAPLFTNDTVPTVDTDVHGDLTEIATGNGYSTGGPGVARSSSGFDVWTEDDTNDWALCQAVDIAYNASGGPIPSTGNGARWMAISDDNGTVASRELYPIFDLVSDRQVSDGQSLTIQDAEVRLTTT